MMEKINFKHFSALFFVAVSSVFFSCSNDDEAQGKADETPIVSEESQDKEEMSFEGYISTWTISPKVEFDTLREKSYWSYNYKIPKIGGDYVLTNDYEWFILNLIDENNRLLSDTISYIYKDTENCTNEPYIGKYISVGINSENPHGAFDVKVSANPDTTERVFRIRTIMHPFDGRNPILFRFIQSGK